MTVNSTKYGKITARKDSILSLIIMLGEAKERYREMKCNTLAEDVGKLLTEMREAYYGPDDFEI